MSLVSRSSEGALVAPYLSYSGMAHNANRTLYELGRLHLTGEAKFQDCAGFDSKRASPTCPQ